MRHTELEPPFMGTATHPHIATIPLDPSEAGRFIRMTEDQPDLRVLGIDSRSPDNWIVFAACASRAGRDMLESEW
jgi:hypothetical protein